MFTEHLKKKDFATSYFFLQTTFLKAGKKIFENLQNVEKFTRKTTPENIIRNNGIGTVLGDLRGK